ncbi:Transposase DDE domain [Moraxella atlantae]|uniref:Transposase DDE domain n=3 Tax=Faucicola atlantae TaxID=34059 RepID=A0A378Q543_9GAMM|nr:IS982 family transposase [Moraxella atlantae]STY94297.1 Transposase DDE domain [Moraxella atlantae]STY95205.1 Transposase DDE domain [Moraxella atlantae]
MDNLEALYCHIDDYCKTYTAEQQKKMLTLKRKSSKKTRNKPCCISLAEIITISVLFHQIRYREFKAFHYGYLCQWLKSAFPRLPSYNRMVELMEKAVHPMCDYLKFLMQGNCTGISYIDSTSLAVCDNHRIKRHKVFADTAARGKSSMGWFYGFKLHVIINDQGELVNLTVTAGNVDDRKPVKQLCDMTVFGKLFGDKGYIDKSLTAWLDEHLDVELITNVKKNMKAKDIAWLDKRLLKRRFLIETVFDELKHICQIEHSRHRSPAGFMANLLAGLIAYCHQTKKPTLKNVLIGHSLPQVA